MSAPSCFLNLPAELRNDIYTYTFSNESNTQELRGWVRANTIRQDRRQTAEWHPDVEFVDGYLQHIPRGLRTPIYHLFGFNLLLGICRQIHNYNATATSTEHAGSMEQQRAPKLTNLSLLLTCRQIYTEAQELAYSLTTFLTPHANASAIRKALRTSKLDPKKAALITSIATPPWHYIGRYNDSIPRSEQAANMVTDMMQITQSGLPNLKEVVMLWDNDWYGRVAHPLTIDHLGTTTRGIADGAIVRKVQKMWGEYLTSQGRENPPGSVGKSVERIEFTLICREGVWNGECVTGYHERQLKFDMKRVHPV